MEKIAYERHTYKHYKDKNIPFIFHQDTLPNGKPVITGLHWHENIEFLCCVSGEGTATTETNLFPFSTGDIITINTNSPHGLSNLSGGVFVYNCLIVDAGFCKENGINVENLRFVPVTVDENAKKLYMEAYEACEANDDFHDLKARTKVLNFLLYMCLNHLELKENGISHSSMEDIKKTVSYIRHNFSDTISLKDAADIAGFSVYYFSREFKKVTGQTFVTFLNTVRCEKAARMLQDGVSVTDACYACGFKELSHFSRTFRRIIGVPPSKIYETE